MTDLPTWSIKPNWANGITETLAWLTDVMISPSGAEQRRSVRLTPRRSFEFTANPVNEERTFLDLCLEQLGNETWMLPLWHDKARLSTQAEIGDTRLVFDTRYREYVVGGSAILYTDAFDYQVVTITAIDDSGLDVNAIGTVAPQGQEIYPLQPAYITNRSGYTSLTNRVGQAQIEFTLDGANPFDPGDEVFPLLDGSPVFSTSPNWGDSLDFKTNTLDFKVDSTYGRVYRSAEVARAFSSQGWSVASKGRAAQWAVRQMLYRQRGRARDLWMPTFNDDVRLYQDVTATNNLLDIRKIGLDYIGGPKPGRNRLWFPSTGEVSLITGMGTAVAPASERLVLSGGLVHAYPKSTVASFLDRCRMDSDTITINHQTDSNGTVIVNLVMRAFSDTRDPSGPIDYPIPEVGGEGVSFDSTSIHFDNNYITWDRT